jgi:hypothetical protein
MHRTGDSVHAQQASAHGIARGAVQATALERFVSDQYVPWCS